MQRRPELQDYPEHIVQYLRKTPEGDLIAVLKRQTEEIVELLAPLTEEQSLYRYAPGKWSIKQLAGHLADTELIFAYRLLRAARNDRTPLPGFEENEFVRQASFDEQPLSAILALFEASRRSAILLMESLKEEEWDRKGIVNGHEGTPLSWGCVIAGHAAHHLQVLEERYFGELGLARRR
ncbi:DinB family protein [Paenibacillus sp. YN15]|uniref:DinB family protein n=1 Tax=Paenibacillus sp. YN15 TaxID=1742774 RepID=UPI0015EC1B60|nr:DinB family protein [Paenibacillus sp. YN15]